MWCHLEPKTSCDVNQPTSDLLLVHSCCPWKLWKTFSELKKCTRTPAHVGKTTLKLIRHHQHGGGKQHFVNGKKLLEIHFYYTHQSAPYSNDHTNAPMISHKYKTVSNFCSVLSDWIKTGRWGLGYGLEAYSFRVNADLIRCVWIMLVSTAKRKEVGACPTHISPFVHLYIKSFHIDFNRSLFKRCWSQNKTKFLKKA